MAIQTLTQITLQQLVNLDSNPITAGKYPKYTVNLGFSISNITASELAGAVDDAQKSAAAAKVSETNAKTSETNAKDSETKAKTSETNAKDSETKAKASETAAKTSETNAKDSETKAKASETAAKTSETNAKDSETKAKTSETNAKASETAAKTSETNAKDSETKAKTSETNAKDSETKAKVSETNAKASEDAADVSEANALASELAAKASENAAKTSETNAKTSETNAKTSETNAASSEEVAVDSAAAAKVSEDAAKLSETNAKTSETNAAESETNAADSAVKAKTEADRAQDISDNLPSKEMFLAYTKLYDTHQEALDDLQYRTVGEKVLIWDETPAAYGWFDVVENDGVKELELDRNELKIKSINNVRPDAAGNVQITLPGGNPSLWLGETVWFPYDPNGTIGYSGVLPQDGRLVLRADYPDAWLAISQGLVPSVSDEEWLAGAQTVFSTGDGSTNFRLPKWDGEVLRAPTDGDTIGSKFDQIPYVTSVNGIGPDEATGNVVIDLTSYAKKGVNNDITNLTGLTASLKLGADGSNPLEAVTLKQMQQAIAAVSSAGGINGVMSTFVGDISWWAGDAALLPTGYVMPNGQLSLRTDYPEIWALIDAGALRSTTEALWNETAATSRGMFTKGTITSGADANFRWPDLNGATTGAIGGLFLRGGGAPSDAGASGVIRQSAAPDVTGAFNLHGGSTPNFISGRTGAFTTSGGSTTQYRSAVQLTPIDGAQSFGGATYTLSNGNSTYGRNGATEVRPNSISGYWIMRAKGTFSAQTDFGVFNNNPLSANATIYGGAIRSVHNYTSGTTETFMRAKTLTNASSVVSSKRMELGVAGGTGVVEINDQGALTSPIRVTAPTVAISYGGYEMNFNSPGNGYIQINRTSNVVTMDFGGLNVQNVKSLSVTSGNAYVTTTGNYFFQNSSPQVEGSGNQNNVGLRMSGSSSSWDSYLRYYLVNGQYHSTQIIQANSATFEVRSNGACYAQSFNPTSDSNLKFEKEFIGDSLSKVITLRGMTYQIQGGRKAGIIAQDAQKVLPESVSEVMSPVVLEDGTILKSQLSLDYASITALNTEALKDVVKLMLECMTSPETATKKLQLLVDTINTNNDDANPIPEGMTSMQYALVEQPTQEDSE